MSMSSEELRRRGLNFARRQIAAGKASKQDIDRWAEELGPDVRQFVRDAAPPKQPTSVPSKADKRKES